MVSSSLTPIDYTSRSYSEIRADLLTAIPEYLPEWTNQTETDFGVVLLELFAYVGDTLNYYIDRVANEAFLTTAVQRRSVLALARLVDYEPSGLTAAGGSVTFTAGDTATVPITIPIGTQVSTLPDPGEDPLIFETTEIGTIVIAGGTATVDVVEGVSREEGDARPVGLSSGAADQAFNLYYTNIIEGSIRIFVDEDGAGMQEAQEWGFRRHLIDASAEERTFTLSVEENGVTTVVFGDNINGRIPTAGAIITAQYRTGVGSSGNVGTGAIKEMVVPIIGIDTVVNASPTTGGTDVEPLSSIRSSAPRSLAAINRAVTLEDYAALAVKVPGVVRAKASASVYTNITLAVAPSGGGAPSTALKDAVALYLSDKKQISASITVGDPTYVPINIEVDPLNVEPQYRQTAVELAVKNALLNLLDTQNVDFGEFITLSKVYNAIQAVEGVDYAVVTMLSTTGSGLANIQLEDDEIPSVGTVTVTSTGGILA